MLIATGVLKLDKWEKQTGALLFIGIFRFLEGLSEAAKVPTEPYPLLPLSVRFFKNQRYIFIYISIDIIYIYNNELAHVIMEAEKIQDLLLASRRSRKTVDVKF